MKRTLYSLVMILVPLLAVCAQSAPDAYEISLRVTGYDISYSIDFESEFLTAECAMTIVNPTEIGADTIPLLLYRLLAVDSVVNPSGNPIKFSQDVTTFDDWSVMQKNYIRVFPERTIESGESIELTVHYSGHLLGYTETGMSYVRDKIDSAFTILRPDCGAYPELGVPNWKASRAAGLPEFDYTVKVTIPKPLVAANGGRLVGLREKGVTREYTFQNIKPAWRIDIAIADYEVIENGRNRIYFFPEHRDGATEVVRAMGATLHLYSSWWGPLSDYEGFAVIEIPEGWGSQADVTSILQTSAAFTDTDQMYQLYHELSHQWNTASLDSIPPRWEEGLATFIQYLTVEELDQTDAIEKATTRMMNSVKERLTKSPNLARTTLSDFGLVGQTGLSYTAGMLFFRLVYDLVGKEEFNALIGSFFERYRLTGATTVEFGEFLKTQSGVQLAPVIQNWLFGSTYAQQLLAAESWSEIVNLYRSGQ